MSRVRNALRLAENWEGKSIFTGQPEPVSRPTGTLAPAIPMDHMLRKHQELDAAPAPRPSGISHWMRRWSRRFLRTTTKVSPCTATTRRGQLCRGLAMHNGYCHMHGGARVRPWSERMLDAHRALIAKADLSRSACSALIAKADIGRQGVSRAVASIARFLTSRVGLSRVWPASW
jgi:hypothetical protein